jgi:hypothetical protein
VHHSCARGLGPIGRSRMSCGPLLCCPAAVAVPTSASCRGPSARPDLYLSRLSLYRFPPAALPAWPPVVADRFLAARPSRRRLQTLRLTDYRGMWLPFPFLAAPIMISPEFRGPVVLRPEPTGPRLPRAPGCCHPRPRLDFRSQKFRSCELPSARWVLPRGHRRLRGARAFRPNTPTPRASLLSP